jgi:hypothetical protein
MFAAFIKEGDGKEEEGGAIDVLEKAFIDIFEVKSRFRMYSFLSSY